METKFAQVVNKGMQRDYSMDKASQEFAYENKNIRITTNGSNSFLSVTNERSTSFVTLYNQNNDGDFTFPDNFVILGNAIIDEKIILFGTTNDSNLSKENADYIYKIDISDDNYDEGCVYLLYNGNLEFRKTNPIECITSYEGEGVQKVYWVDGKNVTRYINVATGTTYPITHSFDFTPVINDDLDVTIEKQNDGSGNFKSGIIQYFITGYQKYGAETNLLYQSPLYYISPDDRGGEIDEEQNCSFKITIKTNLLSITNVRVYSMIRTSLNAEPQTSIVADVALNKDSSNVIIDTNYYNTPVASTDIMFLGGNTIIANTIEQKDNTLFLGDITVKNSLSAFDLTKEELDSIEVGFGIKYVRAPNKTQINEYYPYYPNMAGSSEDSTTFKYLEYYRVGIQFQTNTAEWTSVYPIADVQNTIKPDSIIADVVYNPYSDKTSTQTKTMLYAKLPEELVNKLKGAGFMSWRLVVAQHSAGTRTIKAQGLVLPTLYNLEEKNNKKCGGAPLWTTGQAQWLTHNDNVDTAYKSEVPFSEGTGFHISHMLLSQNTYSKPENNEGHRILTLLSNTTINSTQKKETTGFFIYSIRPVIWVDRIYTWSDNSEDWNDVVGKEAIDVFAGLLEITIRMENNGTFTSYLCRDKNSKGVIDVERGVLPQHAVVYTHALYGQRRSKLEELSQKLKALTFEDIKDYYIVDFYSNSADEENRPTVKSLINYIGSDSVFDTTSIPSGDELRDNYDVDASNNVIINSLSLTFKNFEYDVNETLLKRHKNNYFCNANLCNFYSPEIDNVNTGNKFRIVGYTDIVNTISDYKVNVDNNVIGTTIYKEGNWNLNRYKCSIGDHYNEQSYFMGISSFPIWPFSNRLHFIQYWHQGGHLITTSSTRGHGDGEGNKYFKLESKKYSNMWVFSKSNFLKEDVLNYGNINSLEIYKDQETLLLNREIYKGKYENILFTPDEGYSFSPALPNNPGGTSGVNTTFPLSEITKYIEAGDFIWLDRGGEATTIKYKTSEHIVFNLPNTSGIPNILPNYTSSAEGEMTYTDTSTRIFEVNYVGSLGFVDGIIEEYSYFDKTPIRVLNNVKIKTNPPYYNSYVLYVGDDLFLTNLELATEVNIKVEGESGPGYRDPIPFARGIVLSYNLLFVFYDSDSDGYYYLYIDNGNNSAGNNKDSYDNASILLYVKENEIQPVFKWLRGASESTSKYYFIQKEEGKTNFKASSFKIGSLDNINTTSKYFIGEFYTEYDENTFMGGPIWEKQEDKYVLTTAAKQLTYIPVSGKYTFDLFKELTYIENEDGSGSEKLETKDYSLSYGLEGDTYYQRWDYVRTMPVEDNDENQNIDAFSIMIETYKNLDADSRKLRGRQDVLNLTEGNTNNILNTVYNQTNNYITSNVLDEKFDDYTHPTMYVWSLQKHELSDIDNWTQINLTSARKLSGDKGILTKIKNWNNILYAFQEKGISVINYNQQTTISQDSGIPVEIANSGKVSGHYYITTNQGCKNKWSIIDSPYGLYFIDSYSKSINVINEGIKSLSTINLFQDWIAENENGYIWKPNVTINNGFKSFYDPIHKEVYFVNSNTALCYNELLTQFTSFYDYQNLNAMGVIDGHVYGIKANNIHKMFEGSTYCNLFGEQYDYYIQYKINNEPFVDKTWTNVEYRADIFESGNIGDNNSKISNPLKTFTSLEVWNEYQYGVSDMSDAKPKFRIWRANIPRDNKEGWGLNRIRNPWIMLKLSTDVNNSTKRMEFHDLLIKYLV